mgnify:CR=1 FL=1
MGCYKHREDDVGQQLELMRKNMKQVKYIGIIYNKNKVHI